MAESHHMDIHLPTKLTVYRGITMLASLAAPVLLTFVLGWQQSVSTTIGDLVKEVAAMKAREATSDADVLRRLASIEVIQRERNQGAYDAADAQRDRDIVDERLDLIMDRTARNAEDIDRLILMLDDVCDAIEGCNR